MKDSRIGAYGVLALILVTGLKWLALTALIEAGALWVAVLLPAALSRGAMAGVMASLPFAREDGLARQVGKPPIAAAAVALVAAAILAAAGTGIAGVAAILTSGVAAMAVTRPRAGENRRADRRRAGRSPSNCRTSAPCSRWQRSCRL